MHEDDISAQEERIKIGLEKGIPLLQLQNNMPSTKKEPLEADIVSNRANVALAKSQRLVASWLPPRTATELANAKSEEELEREDRELFAPVPELLGVGASIPTGSDGLPKRRDASAMEKLRVELLGKKAAAQTKMINKSPSVRKPAQKQESKGTNHPREDDSEDDEGGRAATVTSIRSNRARNHQHSIGHSPTTGAKSQAEPRPEEEDEAEEDPHTESPSAAGSSAPIKLTQASKRKTSNFLDEMLAEKSRKKKKKHKKG